MENIAIIGLGLIGGSLAGALHGFENHKIIGVDSDKDTLHYASEHNISDVVTSDTLYAIKNSSIVICCLPPLATINFLETYKDDFKENALVTDVCGVKSAILEKSKCLRSDIDFIGLHPMAGRERGGIINSTNILFKGSHFIIVPREGNKEENLDLVYRMAKYIGCLDITTTSAYHHDQIISYTSQLMHVMAVSVVDDPDLFDCVGFEGGSFRDCTRVAALEPQIWTELFSLNAPLLSECISILETNLKSYREVIESGDTEALYNKLKYSSDRKRAINVEHRRGDDVVLPE